MPLGLARDSMLDLAEYAKKMDEGEYKVEITETAMGSDNLVNISPKPGTQLNTSSYSSSTDFTDPTTVDVEVHGESKTPDLFYDEDDEEDYTGAVNDEDERSSIANSSIDSLVAPATPTSSMNGEAAAKANNYGRYSGFTDFNYEDYYSQDYTAYSSSSGKKNNQVPNLLAKNDSKPLWCCFFPWMNNSHPNTPDEEEEPSAAASSSSSIHQDQPQQPQEPQQQQDHQETLVDVNTTPPSSTIARSSSKEEDDRSIGSDAFGERLSDKDRQAVLARLRLAQPDEPPYGEGGETATTGDGSSDSPTSPDAKAKKGLLNGISLPSPEAETDADTTTSSTKGGASASSKQPRGILRQHSRMTRSNLKSSNSSSANPQAPGGNADRRRSLFPSYDEKPKEKKDVNVNFSPMARVLSVKSHKEMDDDEKGSVWWQKSDYEEFRKTGRMITKAMLEGGSEIWLATNRSWQMPNQARSTTLKHATSLSERQAAKSKGNNQSVKDYENTRDKWWHKFGHSRRGLEHIASIDEGRQRQANVKRAIRAVVEENKRQKAFLRVDADKLRMVSLQHTTWARDLALAAGASDADAVDTNFNDESRKSREFYLLKFSRAQSTSTNNGSAAKANPKSMPAFMRPATPLQVQPNRLDANTMSQIRYRQKVAPMPASTSPKLPTRQPSPPHQRRASTHMPIKESSTSSMAKKAAGFASGEEVANMSAVLTGMGPLPKNATMVGGA